MTRRKKDAVIGRPSVSDPGVRTPPVSFRLPQPLIDDLKAMASDTGRSLSDIFREGCELAVARWKRSKLK